MSRSTRVAVVVLALVVGAASPALADDAVARKARALAAKGQQAFDGGNYDAAIDSFQAAYDTKPHFLMQCNIARCYEMKGDYKAASSHYQRCLDEGADRSPMASQVRAAKRSADSKVPPDERGGGSGGSGGGREPLLPPGTVPPRPFFAQGGMGAGIDLNDVPSQLKLNAIFGYHFSRKASGPAIAFDLEIGLTADFTSIEVGPRFYWDLPIMIRGTTMLLLAPTAMLGFAHYTEQCPRNRSCFPSRNGLTIQVGVEGRLVLKHRALIFFRPISVDLLPTVDGGDWSFGVRNDLMFGGGVIF